MSTCLELPWILKKGKGLFGGPAHKYPSSEQNCNDLNAIINTKQPAAESFIIVLFYYLFMSECHVSKSWKLP